MQFLTFSAYHESSAVFAKVKKFQFEDPSADKRLSIKSLMDEVKPIFKEKP